MLKNKSSDFHATLNHHVNKMTVNDSSEEPFIPENIIVHLGSPDQPTENLKIPFPEYIKNVASNTLYPTWPESAIRANIYAQISFALNRIYTDWYRSRGYDFDITNNPQYDQAFKLDSEVFGNISQTVDEIFNSYVIRQGIIKPIFTAYCDGSSSKCEGLSQWDTVSLAQKGYNPLEILKNYYGNNVHLVTNVPVGKSFASYPLYPLQLGDYGNNVSNIQYELNRIHGNYPSIPQITEEDGVFGASTEAAVKQFQRVFDMPETGVIDNGTWYKIKYVYDSIKDISQLRMEGNDLQLF